MTVAWLGVAPAVAALATTLLNVATWPRGRAVARGDARISILIPARNEAATIARCVEAAAAQQPFEIVVYEDRSTDDTAAILAALRRHHPSLRVVDGVPLPDGWVGKPHACHRLAGAAQGDLLLFVDADTELAPGACDRILGLFADHGADVVTAVPHQRTGSLAEGLVMPLLHLTYTSWLPLFLIHASRDPRFLAANGQVLAVRREALDAIGGFARVAADVVDDMALCRAAKEGGRRVVFADGHLLASTRMYTSAAEILEGFSKNMHEGLGSTAALVGVALLYAWAFVVPYVLLAAGLLGTPDLLLPGLVGVAANVALQAVVALRFGYGLTGVVLHPLGVLFAGAVALNSWRWSRAGAIRWRGRVYKARALRGAGGDA